MKKIKSKKEISVKEINQLIKEHDDYMCSLIETKRCMKTVKEAYAKLLRSTEGSQINEQLDEIARAITWFEIVNGKAEEAL